MLRRENAGIFLFRSDSSGHPALVSGFLAL